MQFLRLIEQVDPYQIQAEIINKQPKQEQPIKQQEANFNKQAKQHLQNGPND